MVVSEGTTEVKNEIRDNEDEKLLVVAPDGEVKEIAVLTEFKKKKNQIQVSNVKKPFFYYYNLSKVFFSCFGKILWNQLLYYASSSEINQNLG